MTLEQMETEIADLHKTVSAMQKKDETRRKHWRSFRFAATFIGLMYIAGSMGCLIAGLFLPRPVPMLTTLQYALFFAALPTILLANVLNEPSSEDPKSELVDKLQRARED